MRNRIIAAVVLSMALGVFAPSLQPAAASPSAPAFAPDSAATWGLYTTSYYAMSSSNPHRSHEADGHVLGFAMAGACVIASIANPIAGGLCGLYAAA